MAVTATTLLQIEETGPKPFMLYSPDWRCQAWVPGLLSPPEQEPWKDSPHISFYCPLHQDEARVRL